MLHNNYIPRISIISERVNRHDEISETIIADLDAIDSLSHEHRRNFDAQVFCLESNFHDSRITVLSDWIDILKSEHFITTDLYYFHCGKYSDLHNAMHYVRRNARSVVYFHDVPPPQYCSDPDQSVIYQSYQQIENFLTADTVMTASAFSAEQLRGYGLGLDVNVVPLFGVNCPPPRPAPATTPAMGQPIKLMYYGPFAPNKGIEQLLEALIVATPKIDCPIELTLAGSPLFSDADYLGIISTYVDNMPAGIDVRFAFDLGGKDIRELYLTSDVVVLPSFHEGFGMSIAEALAAHTPVICSNAGALPEVSGGFGLTYPAGDVTALSEALMQFCTAFSLGTVMCDKGALPFAEWHSAVSHHADVYRREAYIERIKAQFATLLHPTASWRESVRGALKQLSPFGQGNFGDRFDCAVMGVIGADRFIRIMDRRSTAVRSLLAMVFEHEPSDSDITYWLSEWERLGIDGLVSHLSNMKEMRNSPARHQSSVFLKSAINTAAAAEIAHPADPEDDEPNEEDIALILLMQDTRLGSMDFIRTAYRLALHRDPDPSGLAHFLEELRQRTSRGESRSWLIDSLLRSDEAKANASALGISAERRLMKIAEAMSASNGAEVAAPLQQSAKPSDLGVGKRARVNKLGISNILSSQQEHLASNHQRWKNKVRPQS